MTERTLTSSPIATLADDIRQHGYAILQTRVERIPRLVRGLPCSRPDGCDQPATLATLAVEEIADDPSMLGLYLAKGPDGLPLCIPVCEEHRADASHDLYYALTERTRTDGIRAFDVLGTHMDWH